MWCSDRRGVLKLGLAFAGLGLLAGCGFQPLYGAGAPAAGMNGQFILETPDGQPGFVMRERLTERLGEPSSALYRLKVTLNLQSRGAALTQQDYTTRYDVTGVASYEVLPLAGGAPVLTGTVTSMTAYSAPEGNNSSAFASLVAERDAETRLARTLADQIVMELAVTAGQRGK
jgi:LPS-assembly lipoprotein